MTVIWMTPKNLVFNLSPDNAYIGPHPTFLLCKTFDPLGILERPIQMSRKAAPDEMNGELLQAGAQVVGDHFQGEPLLLRMIGTGNHVTRRKLKLHTPHFGQPVSGRLQSFNQKKIDGGWGIGVQQQQLSLQHQQ